MPSPAIINKQTSDYKCNSI